MTDQDRSHFLALITALAATFEREISPAVMEIYFKALEDIPLDLIQHAASSAIRECKFMPRPADLRERCGMHRGSKQDRSLAAWLQATEAASAYGAYRSLVVHDPALAKTIEAMDGWPAFCSLDEPTHFIEKQFRQLYELFDGQRLEPRPKLLQGICEVENRLRGLEAPVQRVALGAPKRLQLEEPKN